MPSAPWSAVTSPSLLCDGAAGIAEQDAKILGLAMDRGRAIVIAVNKTDLLDAKARKGLEEQAREKLSFVPWAPVVPISAKTGRGVGPLLTTIQEVFTAFRSRVSTGQLNRFFEKVLATHPPPTMGNRAPRLFFVTQAEIAPPHFIVMTNEPEHIHFSYQRYLTNQVRKAFGFAGVPLRVSYKKRRRRGDEEEAARRGARAQAARAARLGVQTMRTRSTPLLLPSGTTTLSISSIRRFHRSWLVRSGNRLESMTPRRISSVRSSGRSLTSRTSSETASRRGCNVARVGRSAPGAKTISTVSPRPASSAFKLSTGKGKVQSHATTFAREPRSEAETSTLARSGAAATAKTA